VDSGNATFSRAGGLNHTAATSFTGFTIITSTGTITGSASVFGVAK